MIGQTVPLLLAFIIMYTYGPIRDRLLLFGITRTYPIENIHGHDLVVLPGTKECEDLHFLPSTGLIYTACEGDRSIRTRWFPPMVIFDTRPTVENSDGGLYTINPEVSRWIALFSFWFWAKGH